MRIHNQEFAFKCNICSKKFKTIGNHKVHMDSHLKYVYFSLIFMSCNRRTGKNFNALSINARNSIYQNKDLKFIYKRCISLKILK